MRWCFELGAFPADKKNFLKSTEPTIHMSCTVLYPVVCLYRVEYLYIIAQQKHMNQTKKKKITFTKYVLAKAYTIP